MRNVQKQADLGRAIMERHLRADLIVPELQELLGKAFETRGQQDIYDSVTKAFYMGVAVGHRQK